VTGLLRDCRSLAADASARAVMLSMRQCSATPACEANIDQVALTGERRCSASDRASDQSVVAVADACGDDLFAACGAGCYQGAMQAG
jgi:hypothetical protein